MNERHGFGSLSFISINGDDGDGDGDDEDEEKETQCGDGEMNSSGKKDEGAFVVVKAEGQWRAGKPLDGTNGWTLVAKNGDVYSGFASNFIPEGHGIMQYDNKDVYTGQWRAGRRNGEGMFISADGREEYIGKWIDDKIAPSIIMSKDDGVSRITDLSRVLLKSDNEEEQHFRTNDGSYHNHLDLLQRIMDQSLSQSLMHFENDLKNTVNDKNGTTSWISKADLSQTDITECTETCTEVTEEDIKDTDSSIGDATKEHPCKGNDAVDKSRAQLINYPNGDAYLGTLCQDTKRRYGYGGKNINCRISN